MRKPSLPGAIRMLIYSGWRPCQGFHIDGRGPPPHLTTPALTCQQGGTETHDPRLCVMFLPSCSF